MPQVNFQTVSPEIKTTSFKGKNKLPQKDSSRKNISTKAFVVASAAALAIGTAAILISKNKDINFAKTFFDKSIAQTQGNNKVLSAAIEAENGEVQKFITEHPEGYEKIKATILSMLDVREASEVVEGGVLYHGTSAKSARSILQNGVTPFSEKKVGSASGLGYGFYTTPTREAAEFYSDGGVVLPFSFAGKIGVLKGETANNPNNLKAFVMSEMACILDPPAPGKFSLLYSPSSEAQNYGQQYGTAMLTHAMQDLGIDAVMSEGAVTKGLLSGVFGKSPEFLDSAGQVAVYNGSAIHLDVEKLKELNPITSQNYEKFLHAMKG